MSILKYRRVQENEADFLFSPSLQSRYPRRHQEITVNWRDEKPAISIDEGVLDCRETENQIRCVSTHVAPILLDSNVFYRDIVPQMQIAKDQTWDQVVKNMQSKIDAATRDRTSLDSLSEELQKQESPLTSAIDFASRQIRYVSFSEGEHTNLPHPLEDTIRNRYGDCKDKSTLLVALLDSLGYEAYPVLISTNRSDPAKLKVPSIYHFDHMVVCYPTRIGERCVDPTDAQSSSYATASGIQGQVRLDIKQGSTPEIVPFDEHVWRLRVENQLTFLEDGTQREDLKRVYQQQYGSWYRHKLAGLSNKDRKQQLEQSYKDTISGSQELEINLENLHEPEANLIVNSTTSFEPYCATDQSLDYVDDTYWLQSILRNFKLSNKHYDEAVFGLLVQSDYRFNLSGRWVASDLGPNIRLQSKFGEFTRAYEVVDNEVKVLSHLSIPSQKVPVDETDDYNRFLDFINEETRIRFWADLAEGANQPGDD